MSGPLVTIVTPTFDRPAMFAECAAAVLAQSFTDWVWWVVFNAMEHPHHYDLFEPAGLWDDPRVMRLWFPTTEDARTRRHIPATIINWLYPKVTTPYIYFLADDDLIDPDGLGELVGVMEARQRAADKFGFVSAATENEAISAIVQPYAAVYGRCEVQDQRPDGSYQHACWCYDAGDVGLGTGVNPNCRLDGGQVLHTADLWRRATADGWRLSDTKADAGACDGLLLARFSEFARFHYVPQRIVTHRRHAGATCHKPQVYL